MAYLDIGEVARETGLKTSALRYYENRGLIASTHRNGLRRQYAEEVVHRIALIALCQDAGFSLDEVATLLETDHQWRDLVQARIVDVREQIEQLQRAEEALVHALECPSDHPAKCPHIAEAANLVIAQRRDSSN